MASKINADEFVDREGEGKPTLPKGVVLSGVTTITTAVVAENEVANSTGINVGIITSTHFAGNLTGDVNAGIVTVTSQSVIGSGVTISASGIDIGAGVITATSYAGSGANLTGIGATIMTWDYNPDLYTTTNAWSAGIGITFNQKIKAGSGNITIREDSASGTVVENFAIGSSVTISNNSLEFTPTSALGGRKVYYISLPSGVITNMAGDSYVGTAYTFSTAAGTAKLFVWGGNQTDNGAASGQLGLNNGVSYSSPVQLPGSWSVVGGNSNQDSGDYHYMGAIKTTGELFTWGTNYFGNLGLNQSSPTRISSPTQVGSETTWAWIDIGSMNTAATKTDGTLWSWGYQSTTGCLGDNTNINRSSPIQVPGTSWDTGLGKVTFANRVMFAVRTDGTAWSCGNAYNGVLGLNGPTATSRSSPTQIPGTTWDRIKGSLGYWALATKTDGTLWAWGVNGSGNLGQNSTTYYSSPVQIPGTTWKTGYGSFTNAQNNSAAIKTDGTLWVWGNASNGKLGLNDASTHHSSPIQVGSDTTWKYITAGANAFIASKTDGTLWSWGYNSSAKGKGGLGQNNITQYSSPTQIGTETYWTSDQLSMSNYASFVIAEVTS